MAAKQVIQSLNFEELTRLGDEIHMARTMIKNKARNLQLKAYLTCMGIFHDTEIVNVDTTSDARMLLVFTSDGCFKFGRFLWSWNWYPLSKNPRKLPRRAVDDICVAWHDAELTYEKYMLASDKDVEEWIAQHGDEWKKQNKIH